MVVSGIDEIPGSRLSHSFSLSGVGGPGYMSLYSIGFTMTPAVSEWRLAPDVLRTLLSFFVLT